MAYDGVWTNWVISLYTMFSRGYVDAQMDRLLHKSGPSGVDYDTCVGWVTFEKFMDMIKEAPCGLNPIRS